jgi:uncharacterized membrane protein YeaQ/YmgE (transglycosylase-associated protein family)
MIIVVWLIIGIVAAIAFGSFMGGAGRESSFIWNAAAGAVGGFIGGYLFTMIAPSLVGPGPEAIVGFLGAAIVGAISVMVVRAVMK